MVQTPISRTVYIVSDSTGITAETFSHSVLAQFEEVNFRQIRLPFVDTVDKAEATAQLIDREAAKTGVPPIVFSTLVHPEIMTRVRLAHCIFLDLFGTFVSHIEQELGLKSSHSIGRSHMVATSERYRNRIDAINFSLAHDDGQFVTGLGQADVILVGVSRCGKTPTSLYLAMQYAVKAANFPLVPEDFERNTLPSALASHRQRLFGLSIQPQRLAEVRQERRPNSPYAALEQCCYETAKAESLMRREGIEWLSTTTKSIEEISTTILQKIGLDLSPY
jgi:regulator of PEP synthase PpsR (kinase-PPPase family)